MKIGILTITFNEPDFIVPCIRQFDGFNFPHLVLVSSKPWRGDYHQDNTWALAEMALNNGEVITGSWKGQAEQFNYGLEVLQEERIDWALIVDIDEFYLSEGIGRLVGQIRKTKADIIKAPNMNVYWKTPDYMIIPVQKDSPVIAVKTSIRFTDKRKPNSDKAELFTDEMFHMSYVRTDEQMKKKIEVFEHSNEFDTNFWYNKIWLPWTPDSIMLHPVVPRQFKRAIYNPAPKEIRELIKWDS